jgi:hypothetical protein
MKLWSWVFVMLLALASFESEAARRLGGGGSIGRQSSNVTQRQATPPAAPAQNQAAPSAQPGVNPAATAPRRPWAGMLGGLAAGLGLAWLAHSLGFGEAFGQFLMIALLVLVAMAVIGFVMRSRRGPVPNRPYAFEGAGGPADQAMPPRQYSPDKVGNDASARPWERNSMVFDAGKAGSGSGVLSAWVMSSCESTLALTVISFWIASALTDVVIAATIIRGLKYLRIDISIFTNEHPGSLNKPFGVFTVTSCYCTTGKSASSAVLFTQLK